MTLKKVGPASAATDPDLGFQPSEKGTSNMTKNIGQAATAQAQPESREGLRRAHDVVLQIALLAETAAFVAAETESRLGDIRQQEVSSAFCRLTALSEVLRELAFQVEEHLTGFGLQEAVQ
jgi:hypothetical protein